MQSAGLFDCQTWRANKKEEKCFSSFVCKQCRLQPCQCPAQRPVKRQRSHKIAPAVRQIEGNSRNPVGEPRRPPARQQIGDGAKRPKAKAIGRGQNCPAQAALHVSEKPCEPRQRRPEVEIGDPPGAKAINKAFQQDEYPQRPNHLALKDQGVDDDENGNQLDVGQKRERNLRHKQQGAKSAGQRDIPGFAREISSPP